MPAWYSGRRLDSLFSFRSLPGRLVRLPLRLLPRSVPLPILSGPLRGARWVLGSGQYRYWFGTYERPKQQVLVNLLGPGSVVLDIGAHAGFYSLLAALRVGAGGRVLAFEPLPANVANLRRHTALNRLSNVEIFPVAVADRTGTAGLSPGDDSFSAHLAPGASLTVETVALDDLWKAGRLPKPDLVKIDAEGAELDVLRGARRLLASTRPVVLVASHVVTEAGEVKVHSRAVEDEGLSTHGECCALLDGLGYSISALDTEDVADAAELVARPRARASDPGPAMGQAG